MSLFIAITINEWEDIIINIVTRSNQNKQIMNIKDVQSFFNYKCCLADIAASRLRV